MITGSLSPNTEFDDVMEAIRTFFMPWTWKHGSAIDAVHEWFRTRFSVQTVASFSSGRMAATAILSSFAIGEGDEVLVQAFTCVAVPNSVLWSGGRPVFVDVDASGNISVKDAEKKLTNKTKAVIVQHTFGVSADILTLVAFCKKNNLILIEDCAHSLGVKVDGKLLGTFGDAAFFSFGRDKVLSSVWGGAAIIKNIYKKESQKLLVFEKTLPLPSMVWIATQILHPVIFAISMPLYRVGIGRVMIAVFRLLRFITLPIYQTELTGGMPTELKTRYPNALATLVRIQLKKLDRYTSMRDKTTRGYIKILSTKKKLQTFQTPFGATYLRFPVLVRDPVAFAVAAKKEGILLGNWYRAVIDPKGVSFAVIAYQRGSCPRAEYFSEHIINLPTRLTLRERSFVYRFLSRHV